MNFDKNYLNHDLAGKNQFEKSYFYCIKCNSTIYYDSLLNANYLYKYYILINNNWEELTLTCEEVIIKNIIE